MKVSELIELLSKENPDAEVLVPYVFHGQRDGYTDNIELESDINDGGPVLFIEGGNW